jgi:hypothetical protein
LCSIQENVSSAEHIVRDPGVKYVIRLPSNAVLEQVIEELLTRQWGGPVTNPYKLRN